MDFAVFERAWSAARDAVAVIPDAALTLLVGAATIVIAVITHSIVMTLIRRALADRYPFLRSVLTLLHQPLRVALSLLALNFVVTVTPLNPDLIAILTSLLQLALIGLVGWMLVTTTNIAADLYLRRFDLEAEANLLARKHITQVRVLKGALNTLIVIMTVAAALMTFEQVRQYGVSLFASAGIAGIVVGLAARPMLSNLIAGIQLAITQPIRIEDAVIVENEFGFIEEITSTYVVVRLWDLRRMIVPLTYFIEKPFQNWTRDLGSLIGSVSIRADYTVPVEELRAKLNEIVKSSPLWDGKVAALQVTNADEFTVELRALASARNASAAFDLRCLIREKLIDYLAREHPYALPHRRQEQIAGGTAASARDADALRASLGQRGR
jgi:small-conductance mechanosensitive channel